MVLLLPPLPTVRLLINWSAVNVLFPKLAKLPVAVTPFCQILPLYTFSSLEVVLKNKSPLSKLVVGLEEPTLYLSAKSFISPLKLTRSLSASVALW